jgi:hypothetical protein
VSIIHDHVVASKSYHCRDDSGHHHDQGARDDEPNMRVSPPGSIILRAKSVGHDGSLIKSEMSREKVQNEIGP